MSQSTEKTLLFIVLIIVSIFLIFKILPLLSLLFLMRPGLQFGFKNWIVPAAIFPLIFILIIWIFIVVWVYRDAERRTMNGILWALLVFFGNFVGLLIYLIVRSEQLPKRIASDVSESCPGCGKTVPQNYAFCPHCGIRLKAVCHGCDKPVSSDWKVCPYCGQKLAEEI
jgi:RNA polymerase subunit RPABC4/transcription elongation factor Spt4